VSAAGRPRPVDPTGAFANLLDDLEGRVKRVARTARLDEKNRINLLFGHAVFAMLVAPGFAMLHRAGMSGASFSLLRRIPGVPLSMAIGIGAAGVLLAVSTWHRNRMWEFTALLALLAWYVVTSASFVGAILLWVAEPGPVDWIHAPSLYAPVVYAHLAYAMAGHARTLRRKGLRPDPPGSTPPPGR
jgi:hypothetical protein